MKRLALIPIVFLALSACEQAAEPEVQAPAPNAAVAGTFPISIDATALTTVTFNVDAGQGGTHPGDQVAVLQLLPGEHSSAPRP